MKLLADTLLVFLVMLAAAALVAWVADGGDAPAEVEGSHPAPRADGTQLAALLGLR